MKTARFTCRGEAHFYPFSPIYTCDLDSPMADKFARASGDYVPLAEAEAMAARVAVLEAALRHIADPIAQMRRHLKPDEQIDGMVALMASNDANHLKSLARLALATTEANR